VRTKRNEFVASWWVALTLVPMGFTAWAAFVYAGIRGGRRLWTGFGVLYLLLIVAGIAVAQFESLGTLAGVIILVTWIGAFGHALVIRPEANRWIAARSSPELLQAEEREIEKEQARSIALHDPRRARELGIGRPDRQGFDGGLIDLNGAPESLIAGLPGMTADLARRIVTVREEIGGFSSLNDLGEVLSLDARTVDRLRPEVVVLPRD
jgi:Helix-hairpin-helix motif